MAVMASIFAMSLENWHRDSGCFLPYLLRTGKAMADTFCHVLRTVKEMAGTFCHVLRTGKEIAGPFCHAFAWYF